MALITCPECIKKISDTIDQCPHCGYKITPEMIINIKKGAESSKKIWSIMAIAVVAFFIGIYLFGNTNTQKSQNSREDLIAQGFDWDGSHKGLTTLIKKTMHNPDSFKHVASKYSDNGDYLFIKTTFRGTNTFGAVVTNWISAKVDLNGKVIQVVDQGQGNGP